VRLVIQGDDGIDHILHDDLAMVTWDNFTVRQLLLQDIRVTVEVLLEEARTNAEENAAEENATKESTDG
jgi:hypothetical protein